MTAHNSKLNQEVNQFTTLHKAFNAVVKSSGLLNDDYKDLYNKYLYGMRDSAIGIVNLLGYECDDSFTRSFQIIDRRTDKAVRFEYPSTTNHFSPSGDRKMVEYSTGNMIAIYFVLQYLNKKLIVE